MILLMRFGLPTATGFVGPTMWTVEAYTDSSESQGSGGTLGKIAKT